jgi:hypothetical protein
MEFGRVSRPYESWNRDTQTYRITHTRHLGHGLFPVRSLAIEGDQTNVIISPADEDRFSRVVTRVTAKADSLEEAQEAARERLDGVSIERKRGKLSIHEARETVEAEATEESVPVARDDGPDVFSRVTVYLPPKRFHSASVSTESGIVSLHGVQADADIRTGSGDVAVADIETGSVHVSTVDGRVKVANFGGEQLDVKNANGDIIIQGVHEAAVDASTDTGYVLMHSAEVATPSRVATRSGDIDVGISNPGPVQVELYSRGRLHYPQEPVFEVEDEGVVQRGDINVRSVRGHIGSGPTEAAELVLESRTGNISVQRDITGLVTDPIPTTDTP